MPRKAMPDALVKQITYSGKPAVVMCDGQCDKAWGVVARPKVQLGTDVDDNAYLSDDELGVAPVDPGTYEGGDAKPTQRPMTGDAMNKWCVRQCERSVMTPPLHDFSRRVYNQPWKHTDA